jgi:predicted enzyme related to lactoylglutathione lyase
MAERVVHFEITADDPERAATFYREAFGWSVDKWEGPVEYWLAGTGEGLGIDGAVMGRSDFGQAVINTIQIEGKLEDAVDRVAKAGGKQHGEIQPIPGVGRFTYALDTEGNYFGMMEPEAEG